MIGRLRRLFSTRVPLSLPTFVVAGATRSGTDSLHSILLRHPEIFVPSRKELHYFDTEWFEFSLPDYLQNFKGYGGQPVFGELTPTYWEADSIYSAQTGRLESGFCDGAINRVARHLPGVKVIISLREPFSRLRSIFVKNFLQGKSYASSLEAEILREREGLPSLRLLERSNYPKFIRGIFDRFDRSNVFFMVLEEWSIDPSVLESMLKFLGCTSTQASKIPTLNRAIDYGTKSPSTVNPGLDLSANERDSIGAQLSEIHAATETVLERKLPWWSPGIY